MFQIMCNMAMITCSQAAPFHWSCTHLHVQCPSQESQLPNEITEDKILRRMAKASVMCDFKPILTKGRKRFKKLCSVNSSKRTYEINRHQNLITQFIACNIPSHVKNMARYENAGMTKDKGGSLHAVRRNVIVSLMYQNALHCSRKCFEDSSNSSCARQYTYFSK